MKQDWNETLDSILEQIEILKKEIPEYLKNPPDDGTENREFFNMKISAMQSRLKRSLKEISNSTQPFKLIKH